ncbi:MAG: (2Fe-2S) ferredoxin domain-containing protein [Burkholderiales bacterium]|nr:(2Fe-2S) ferredoxin domain-containing protein [Burkholderiales bacterium]
MSYYQRHMFFCCNDRSNEVCCESKGGSAMRNHAKKQLLKLAPGKARDVRINLAGCLNRCVEGPVVVIYPDAVWYTYVDEEDINEIVEEHLIGGRPVERLRI